VGFRPALLAVLAIASIPALAGRPLTTEDASIQEDKACQVETWIDRSREATQGWFVPACNFGANIEWQAGFARRREDGSSRFSEAYFQAKTLWRPSEDAPWAIGLVTGVTRKQREGRRGWENPYVIVPLSVTSEAAGTSFHFDVGWGQDRADERNVTLWGVAAESAVTPRLTLLAEAFGENAARPFLRAGGRYSLIKDRLDMDLTVVTRSGGTRAERFVSLGLFWQTGRFLP
jgi:hypothetical protein